MRSFLHSRQLHLIVATPVALMAVLVACSSSSDSGGAAQGTEGGACYGNSSCNAGLTCASNLCVSLGMDAAAAVDSSSVARDASADASVLDASDAAPAAWTPGSLANLTLWVEGTKGITVSGGNVTGWTDQSAGHHDLVGTGTIASMPLNGVPCARGAGAASLTTTVTLAKGPWFIEAVTPEAHAGAAISFRGIASATEFGIVPNQDSLNRNAFIAMLRQNSEPSLRTPDTTLALLESPHFVAAYYDGDKGLTLRVDGNQVGSMSAAATVITSPVGQVTLGFFDNAAVCEMVFVAGTPPTADVAKLDSYLKAKYGL